MKDTYTYTARSAHDPRRVVTFTLYDHTMSIGLGPPLEQLERALPPESVEIGAEREPQPGSWLKPVVVSMLQRGTRPFRVGDVDVTVEDGGLRVVAWVRAGALRLAPATFAMERVDNPEAARAFVQELNKRRTSAAGRGKLPGPLEYWLSWFLAILFTSLLLLGWVRKKGDEAE